jgi:hypothetical protein
MVLGYELRASHILPLQPCPQPFLLFSDYFQVVLYFGLGPALIFLFMASHTAGSTGTHQHAQLLFFLLTFTFWWDWGLNSELYPGKAGTLILEPQLQSILL